MAGKRAKCWSCGQRFWPHPKAQWTCPRCMSENDAPVTPGRRRKPGFSQCRGCYALIQEAPAGVWKDELESPMPKVMA